MTHHIPSIYESYELDIKKLLLNGESLTFLVGAGISIEPPSNLMSAWQIMEAIVRFGAIEEAVPKILKIRDLRFEYLIQQFRDGYDNQLKFMEYYERSTQPNLIHQFLAQMIQAGQYVMTTNFDTLIERAVGLDNDNLRVIITRKDFEQYSDPQSTSEKGLLPVYKLHGSLKNPKTDEDTSESVITTIDALGKHKEGEIFAIETFKRDFFARVCQGRTLVVMGYSGGDDFDIVPTLLQMQGLKQVIWIAHSKEGSKVEIYRLAPKFGLIPDEIANLSREDKVLYDMRILDPVEVIKVNTHTASLISDLTEISVEKPESIVQYNAYNWIVDHFSRASDGTAEVFTAIIFRDYCLYDDALHYFQQAYEIHKRLGDQHGMATDLGSIGSIYTDKGEQKKALEYQQQAYEIYERLGHIEAMEVPLSVMGGIYMDTGDPAKALEFFFKAYEIAERFEDLQGMVRQLGNIGLIYKDTGEPQKALDHFQKAYKIGERFGDLQDMATGLSNIAIVYRDKGEPKKALEYHQKAYGIHKRLGNPEGMANELGNMGITYASIGEPQKALEHFQKAFEIHERIGNLHGIARYLLSMGGICVDTGEYQMALEHLQKAINIYERLGDLAGIASTLGNISL
ncbi:MAG: tetratricopeptide repeat protein, partial [Promethearchaeota archaeon]